MGSSVHPSVFTCLSPAGCMRVEGPCQGYPSVHHSSHDGLVIGVLHKLVFSMYFPVYVLFSFFPILSFPLRSPPPVAFELWIELWISQVRQTVYTREPRFSPAHSRYSPSPPSATVRLLCSLGRQSDTLVALLNNKQLIQGKHCIAVNLTLCHLSFINEKEKLWGVWHTPLTSVRETQKVGI